MPIDSLFIKGLCAELDSELRGGRIDKIYMPRRDQVLISVRTESGTKKLMLSVGGYPAVWITEGKYENPDTPPMFCMLLRKQLSSGRIISVTQPERERIVEIKLTATDEMGDISEKRLIAEFIGRQKNIVIVGANGIISACLHSAAPEKGERAILPGLLYSYPKKSDRPSWLDLSENELNNVIENLPENREKSLCSTLSGLTLSLAREAFSDENPAGWLYSAAKSQTLPYLIFDGENVTDVSAVKTHGKCQKTDSFCGAIEKFYGEKSLSDNINSTKNSLEKVLFSAKKRLEKKLAEQRIELFSAKNREEFKQKADLITANIAFLNKGDKSAEVTDYYSPDLPKIIIELDPLLSPQQNAQKLYKKYARLKNAEMHLNEQISKGESELSYLNSLLYALSLCKTVRDAETVRAEAREAGFIKKERKREKIPEAKPRIFTTDGGFQLLCGRNNYENDEITHRIAAKRDIWFHARNIPGSHVVLITNGEKPGERDILQGAELAAYFSSSKGDKIAVDYTEIKNVKKPTGARPGAVNYFEYKSVLVKPALPEEIK